MKLKLIVFLLTAAFAGAETFAIVPKFNLGQQFKIEIKTSREDPRQGRGGSSKSDVLLKVIEVNAKGAVADWTITNTVLLIDIPADQRALFDAMSKAVEGIHFELQFNTEGEFTGLRNSDEVAGKMAKMAKILTAEVTKTLPDTQKQAFTTQLSRILNPSTLITSATKNVQLLFNLSGAELETGTPATIQLESPNPLGGEGTLPSVFEIHLDKVSGGEAHVRTVQRHDGKALLGMVTKLIGKAPEGEMPQMEMVDTGEFVFNTDTKLAKRVRHVRKISAGPIQRTDTTDITVTAQ
ncbi:MAG TPA: hypothetical protein VEX68_29235 [Bryobacteraceae bacterium]|nr:hypothetical protein [Bryobacteraceae bacterium]